MEKEIEKGASYTSVVYEMNGCNLTSLWEKNMRNDLNSNMDISLVSAEKNDGKRRKHGFLKAFDNDIINCHTGTNILGAASTLLV